MSSTPLALTPAQPYSPLSRTCRLGPGDRGGAQPILRGPAGVGAVGDGAHPILSFPT